MALGQAGAVVDGRADDEEALDELETLLLGYWTSTAELLEVDLVEAIMKDDVVIIIELDVVTEVDMVLPYTAGTPGEAEKDLLGEVERVDEIEDVVVYGHDSFFAAMSPAP